MKNKKTCDFYMEEFLALDKNESIPFALCVHLLCCKTCRSQVRMLYLAEKKAAEPLRVSAPITDEKIVAIMKAVDPSYNAEKACPVSLKSWLIAGAIMVFGMLFFIFSYAFVGFSASLSVWIYLTFGICIALYCACFVGSNMDFFVKKIEKSPYAVHLL